MDDKDRYDPQNSDTEDDVDVWPNGVIAGQGAGAASGTSTGTASAGALAGGVIGAAQAGRITEAQEPEEQRPARVPPGLGAYGDERRVTGDEGVSDQQREAEAGELNG